MKERGKILILILSLISIISSTNGQYFQVTTNYGIVQGNALEQSNEFLGIPFAQPPLNTLRFSPPVSFTPPLPPTEYIQQATSYQLPCIQELGTEPTSEDCLYLNIFTPQNAENLPVMIWIHGGGFIRGSATKDTYNGTILATTHNVIVVSISYRLGALGFMAENVFCEENEHCGMYGILDQQLAMQWVQQNIFSFGGNPNNITIFGESAGGMSVAIQLSLASSSGLYHGAIIESGICEGYQSLLEAEKYGREMVISSGCYFEADPESIKSCMRNLPAETILGYQQSIKGTTWWPVINNVDLSQQPIEYLYSGQYNQVPVLLGCNSNEGYYFALALYPPPITPEQYVDLIMEEFGEFGVKVLEVYPLSAYNGNAFKAVTDIVGDYTFVCPAAEMITAINNANTEINSFMYLFNHTPSWGLPAAGAYHAAEIPFVFGYRPEGEAQFDADEEILSSNMTTWWTNFAKHRNPNWAPNIPFWPRYSFQNNRIVFNTPLVDYITSYRTAECEMWSTYQLDYSYPIFSHSSLFFNVLVNLI